MSVKTIFKTLIGTVVVIILISLCIELFNVNVSGLQIKSVCNMSVKQSAELFTQETYRGIGDVYSYTEAQTCNMRDIKASDGTVYISGNFYGNGTTVHEIWNKLYGPSNTTFKNVCTMSRGTSVTANINVNGTVRQVKYTYVKDSGSNNIKYGDEYVQAGTKKRLTHQAYPWAPYKNSQTPISVYKDLGELYAGIHEPSVNSAATQTITFEDFENNSYKVIQKNYAINAKKLKAKYYTPVNVGFPYFDAEVVNKIFQWNLAMVLSNGLSESIVQDETGKYYINYKGFRCYVQDAYISDFEYYILDAKSDISKLKSLVNIDANALKMVTPSVDNDIMLENSYITVVGLKYQIPISYQGISPLKNIIEYAWNNEVNGQTGSAIDPLSTDRTGMTGTGTYDFSSQVMTNENSATNGTLSTMGEIYYILVR